MNEIANLMTQLYSALASIYHEMYQQVFYNFNDLEQTIEINSKKIINFQLIETIDERNTITFITKNI